MSQFVPFLLILLVIAAFLRIDFFFTVVYFLGGIYLLTRYWGRRAGSQLRVERHFVDRAFAGERVDIALDIRNGGLLPVPWVEVTESIVVDLLSSPFPQQVMTLGPRECRTFRYTVACRKRGYYTLGPSILRSGDVLDISRHEFRAPEPRPMIVYPRIVPLHNLGLPTQSALVALPATSHLFEDPSRIMGIREYQRGDSPRRIHWPASAHAGRALVKQYQPAIARETMIYLDLNENDYEPATRADAIELAIVTAASLAAHIMIEEGLPAGLATEAVDPLLGSRQRISLPPRRERTQLTAILEVLARIQPVSSTALDALLREESVHLSWGTTAIVITGQAQPELDESLLLLRRSGLAVALIVVQPGSAALDLAPIHGIPVHHVRYEQDLVTAWV